jgi:hypothetical protein
MPAHKSGKSPSSALDDVLEAVRADLEARRVAALARATEIKDAALAYAEAVEREALAEFATKVGVAIDAPGAVSVTAHEVARALEKMVARLPELRKSPEAPPKPVPEAKGRPQERAPAGSKAVGQQNERTGALSAKLAVPAALRDKVTSSSGKTPSRDEASARDAPPGDYPRLRAASERGRIVIVGGLAKHEALGRLKARLGFEPEWIETDKAGQNGIRKLEGRILDGRVAAVVVLDGLIGHSHFEPLARATRQTGTLLVYGDRAGRASLEKALAAAEGQLEKKKR